MSICRLCGINEVAREGEICELCQLTSQTVPMPVSPTQSEKPLIVTRSKQTTKKHISSTMPPLTTNNYQVQNPTSTNSAVQNIYSAAGVAQQSVANTSATANYSKPESSSSIVSGIVKNITNDVDQRSGIDKYLTSLFTGEAYPTSSEMTLFQVFPDYTGSALNQQGNACDQIIVYGSLKKGSVCENNDVEIFGRREKNNTIVCSKIVNKASGVTIFPEGAISGSIIRILTLVMIAILIVIYIQLFS